MCQTPGRAVGAVKQKSLYAMREINFRQRIERLANTHLIEKWLVCSLLDTGGLHLIEDSHVDHGVDVLTDQLTSLDDVNADLRPVRATNP